MDRLTFIYWFLNHYDVPDFAFEHELNSYNSCLLDADYDLLKEHIENHCKIKPTVLELNRIIKQNDYVVKLYPRCYALQHAIDIYKTEHIEMQDFPAELKLKINYVCEKLGMPKRFEGIN